MYERELADLIRDEMDEHAGEYSYVTDHAPSENAAFTVEFFDGTRFLVIVQGVQE